MRKLQTVHLPVLPLRGLMIFPNMVLHFDVGRHKSVMALERGMSDRQKIFLVSQKDEKRRRSGMEDLCKVGTIAESPPGDEPARREYPGACGGQDPRYH
jgi:ATP-dependent Lon protease, bacterial type